MLLNAPVSLPGQTINRYEYFFDTDPGVGNGIGVSVTAADSVSVNIALNIAALTPGFHKAGIRFRNTAGVWSHAEVRSFFIQTLPLQNRKITTAEYFIGNTDPGIGMAHPVTITNPADSVTIIEDTILNNLPLSTYKINIRFKDEQGVWSHLETRTFTVCATYGAQSEFSYQVEGNRIFFTNQSLYNDTSIWKFGDNTTASVVNPIKTYTTAGSYNVQLITGNNCGYDTLQQTILVKGLQMVNAGKAGNGGIATIRFSGFGFNNNTNVALVKDGITLTPLQKFYQSPRSIIGYFDFNGQPTGFYHAVALLGGAFDTLYNAFEMVPYIKPALTINVSNSRFARPGRNTRVVDVQNRGNQDAILVPVTSEIGFVAGVPLFDPQYYTSADMVFLNNKGIFQHTYNYLNTHNISTDIMMAEDIDSIRKKKLISYMKLKVPAGSRTTDVTYISTSRIQPITLTHGLMVHPPYFSSDILNNNLESPARDCMNSFLKKAVKKNLTVTINDPQWNICFNEAFDTLSGTIRDIVKNLEFEQQAIPSKAVFSALLAKMTECTSSGMPPIIGNQQFSRIIKDMTYNWFFYENIDSLGKPCFDTIISISGNQTHRETETADFSRNMGIANDECPGALIAPELAEECEIFLKPCKMLDDTKLTNSFISALIGVGSELAGDIIGLAGDFCTYNTGTAFCEKLCEMTSIDPNIKDGPGNNRDEKHINHFQTVNYSIRFENADTATAPAAYVEIRDTIDLSVFDIQSFQAGAFGWGDSIVKVEANRKNISLLKDLRPAHPNMLRADITVDTITGEVVWKLWTVDTLTQQLTNNPAQGFLPPNVNGTEGVGFVSFSIRPRSGLTSGAILQNRASIVFDENAPIITPFWEYRIDTIAPVSQVYTLPAVQTNKQFQVDWSGSDIHSGIRYYSVYVSVNDSIYKQWKRLTTSTSDVFTGEFGNTYKFFSIALDKAGNFEKSIDDPFKNPDAVTRIEAPTSVRELEQTGIKIFPTVTRNNIFIQATGKKLQAELLTITGQRLQTIFINQQAQLNMADLPNGIYLLRLLPLNTTIKIMKY